MEKFQTPPMQYKDKTYWIAGEPETKRTKSKYHYYIRQGKKAIASEDVFQNVTHANIAARAAIDLMIAVVEEPPQPESPPRKPRSTTKRTPKEKTE